jgi:hypothetical protein
MLYLCSMKTTYIKEEDVMQVANDLEQIVTSEMVDNVLIWFDDEMAMNDGRSLEFVIQDLINDAKNEHWLIQCN